MLKTIVVAAAISLAFGSFPALAQKKSCDEFCRTGPCAQQGAGSINSCMSSCVQKCAIKRSGGK
jgi:hypothetical protein